MRVLKSGNQGTRFPPFFRANFGKNLFAKALWEIRKNKFTFYNYGPKVKHSDFHCVGVSGPLKSFRGPQDVIYFLKAITNSFQTDVIFVTSITSSASVKLFPLCEGIFSTIQVIWLFRNEPRIKMKILRKKIKFYENMPQIPYSWAFSQGNFT